MVVTSYEIVIADSKLLQRYTWKYIIVDEGHRLKNFNCKLLRELRQIPVDNKLLLTGVMDYLTHHSAANMQQLVVLLHDVCIKVVCKCSVAVCNSQISCRLLFGCMTYAVIREWQLENVQVFFGLCVCGAHMCGMLSAI